MCFSAAASFTAAGLLLLIGVISIALVYLKSKPSMSLVQKLALTPMAALPLLFGFHQLTEGCIWLDHDNQAAVRSFAYTAYSFWPMYISVSMALVEWTRFQQPRNSEESRKQNCFRKLALLPCSLSAKTRRWLLVLNVFIGTALFLVMTVCLALSEPIYAVVDDGRLDYWFDNDQCHLGEEWYFYLMGAPYLYVVSTSPLYSSIRLSNVVSLMAVISFAITVFLWTEQFESTWCYFAAIISCAALCAVWLELKEYPDDNEEQEQDLEQKPDKEESTE